MMDEKFNDQCWTNKVQFKFEAAHSLPLHQGKCSRLHGHSFVGHVYTRGRQLHTTGSRAGMLDDFGNVKGAVQRLVSEKLDHWYLNETTELENPTSEELARWIFDWLESRVNGLHAVEIAETCTTSSMYRRPVVNA